MGDLASALIYRRAISAFLHFCSSNHLDPEGDLAIPNYVRSFQGKSRSTLEGVLSALKWAHLGGLCSDPRADELVGRMARQMPQTTAPMLHILLQLSPWLRLLLSPRVGVALFCIFLGISGCRKTSGLAFSPPLLSIFCRDGIFYTGSFKGEPGGLAIIFTPAAQQFFPFYFPPPFSGLTFFPFLDQKVLKNEFRALLLAVGQPLLKGFHGFRRFFASVLAFLGKTQAEIAKFLGHTDPKYAQPYVFEFSEGEKGIIKAQLHFFDFFSPNFPFGEKPSITPPKRARGPPEKRKAPPQ
jgi:hypothetical protein